mgnify:CR=1 FL=1
MRFEAVDLNNPTIAPNVPGFNVVDLCGGSGLDDLGMGEKGRGDS